MVRAAVHVHSEWSYHATWPLRSIARAFSRLGYDVVLLADHDRGFTQDRWNDYRRACADASSDRILLVPGIEYEDPESIVHTLVWGDEIAFFAESRPTVEVLRWAKDQAAAAIFAHPWRRNAISRYRSDWAGLLSGVEVWNRQYDGIAPNPSGRDFAERENLQPFASLDFHSARQLFPLGMAIEIAGDVRIGPILASLQDGRCRPDFAGLPALAFGHGIPGAALRTAELGRQALRSSARGITRLVAG